MQVSLNSEEVERSISSLRSEDRVSDFTKEKTKVWHNEAFVLFLQGSVTAVLCIFKVPNENQPRHMHIALCSDLAVKKNQVQMSVSKENLEIINNAGIILPRPRASKYLL